MLNQHRNIKAIIFTQTKLGSERLALVLNHLGFSVECLHGDMSQTQRFKSLNKFKEGEVKILVTTDVAARGIDISMIELVINYDLCDPKSYIHRVGRTARIGRDGKSITIVTQYDVEAYKKIEEKLGF
jgi:ATP-dependent RNA helicase DDX47/RRP3